MRIFAFKRSGKANQKVFSKPPNHRKYMQTPLRLTLFSLFIATLFQFTALYGQDLKPLLVRLTPQQKLQLLEYIRTAGTDIDQEIIWAFTQLGPDGQQKVQQYLNAIQPRTDGRPERTYVRWSRDTIQLGEIQEGTIYLDSITVTNKGSRPYSITNVKTACDCTVLQVPKFPVLPGESATLRFEFNSRGKKGKIKTGIVIEDNSTPNTRSIIYLKGTVKGEKGKKRPWD